MTEKDIEEGCKHGDNIARKELYRQYGGLMLGIIIRYVGNREQAKDLLHDGFIKAFNSFDKFTWRGEGSLKAWLSRLFVNQSLIYLRKAKELQNFVSLDDVVQVTDIPEEDDVMRMPQELIMKFIADLPAGYRTVFNLYVLDGLSHKEIGKLLNIAERTSASQFFRAKQLLAHRISNYLSKLA